QTTRPSTTMTTATIAAIAPGPSSLSIFLSRNQVGSPPSNLLVDGGDPAPGRRTRQAISEEMSLHHGGTEATEKYTEKDWRRRTALVRVLLRVLRVSVVRERSRS